MVANIEHSIPLGRTGRPEEIAWLLAYLASPAGDFYSGTTITIDGARDNWVGPWPPESVATESGDLPAEQRRSEPGQGRQAGSGSSTTSGISRSVRAR